MAAQDQLVKRAMPLLKRAGPLVLAWLAKAENRERAMQIGRDLLSRVPGRRLVAKAEMTEGLAAQLLAEASTPDERRQAEEWSHRAHRLRVRVDLPVRGRPERKQRLASLAAELDDLHREIDATLRS